MPVEVAALYIDPRGPYPSMPNVDAWDASRNARKYSGPYPVVAHPPCGPWGRLRQFATKDSPRLGIVAVEQVQRWGGVLEHPSHSTLWDYCGLPAPGAPADSFGGYTLDVRQVEWGHRCEKRTWLYLVGVPRQAVTPPPFPGRAPTHVISTSRRTRGLMPELTVKWERAITPPAFAEWLVGLARSAAKEARLVG